MIALSPNMSMTSDTTHLLTQRQLRRDLVSIRRDEIDGHLVHGYVLAVSADLVALQVVHEFRLEGLMLLRVADITSVEHSDADVFHRQLLVREGLEQLVPFDRGFALDDWSSAIRQLAGDFPLIIIECESLDDDDAVFLIGRLHAASRESVDIEYFDGVARWDNDLHELAVGEITSCRVDSNYLNVYARHFERQRLS